MMNDDILFFTARFDEDYYNTLLFTHVENVLNKLTEESIQKIKTK